MLVIENLFFKCPALIERNSTFLPAFPIAIVFPDPSFLKHAKFNFMGPRQSNLLYFLGTNVVCINSYKIVITDYITHKSLKSHFIVKSFILDIEEAVMRWTTGGHIFTVEISGKKYLPQTSAF